MINAFGNDVKCNIAIISLYYNNFNYGGQLQAYALQTFVEQLSPQVYAEQLCFDVVASNKSSRHISQLLRKYSNPIRFIKKSLSIIKRICVKIIYGKTLDRVFENRNASFKSFSQTTIRHSDRVFTQNNICETVDQYDAFITGSDQVWNTEWYTPVFFLDFVPSDKIKFSYAASISKDRLTDAEKELFKKSLADYKAVSVREENAVEMLRDLSPVEVELVLDPTLLLSREDWDKVCDERVIQEDYIFCYFLGENKAERKLTQAFAKRQGIKIVSIPLTGAKIYSDLKFGDFVLPAASPEQFISLIKYAKYVFTDSFHAVVFSYLYEKQFFVFNRDAKGTMNSRIKSITKLLHMEDRFCGSRQRETIEYISALQDIDYKIENPDFEALKDKSIAFLKRNLTE